MNRSTIDLWVGIFVTIGLGAHPVPGAEGRQSADHRQHARLSARGELRQYRRAQAARAGQGRRRGRRTRRKHQARPQDLRGGGDDARSTSATQFSQGHDRLDPHLGPARRGSTSALDAGGDTQHARRRRPIAKTQSAVVLEKLISQFLFDKASAGAGSEEMTKHRSLLGTLVLAVLAPAARRLRHDAVERRPARAVQSRDVRGARSRSTVTSSSRSRKAT